VLNMTPVTETLAQQPPKNATTLTLQSTGGLQVGDVITLAKQPNLLSVSNAVNAQNFVKNPYQLTMQKTAGWSVGDVVTGVGLAANTVITNISGSVVTLSVATQQAINAGAVLAANPAITKITGNNVTLSAALTTAQAAQFKVNANIVANNEAFAPQTFITGISSNTVTLSSPTTAQINGNAGINATQLVPGMLILRSAGDLTFNQTLTDGFASQAYNLKSLGLSTSSTATQIIANELQNTYSWSYDLVAGADLSSSDQNRTVATGATPSPGSLYLAAGTLIRTGTGDISINAAGDINMYDNSMIYSAGRQDPANPWGYTTAQMVYDAGKYSYYAEYPINGGDVLVSAGGNINVNLVNAGDKLGFYSDWLVSQGGVDNTSGTPSTLPTSWGINFAKYDQNLGALGGGNIVINAVGNINNLTVAIPTTAKIDPRDYAFGSTALAPLYSGAYATPIINGGGNLTLSAGGNIAGGAFYVEQGVANISAAGSLDAGSYYATTGNVFLNPILALGNAQMFVTAGQAIDLATIINPLALASPATKKFKRAI